MTATSRRNWREEENDSDDEDKRKASQKEWAEMMQEVEESREKMLTSSIPDETSKSLRDVTTYDDVVVEKDSDDSDSEADVKGKEDEKSVAERDPYMEDGDGKEDKVGESRTPAAEARRKMQTSLCEEVPKDPEEQKRLEELDETKRLRLFNLKAINEEKEKDQQEKDKKRGGKKESGAKRKRKKGDAADEKDGAPPFKKKKKTDEDPNRWITARLDGEDKPKKLDTTRLVTYRDFDLNPERQYTEFDYVPSTHVSGKAKVGGSEASSGSKTEKKEEKKGDEKKEDEKKKPKRDFRSQMLYEDLFE